MTFGCDEKVKTDTPCSLYNSVDSHTKLTESERKSLLLQNNAHAAL